jgi:hypothetical protein
MQNSWRYDRAADAQHTRRCRSDPARRSCAQTANRRQQSVGLGAASTERRTFAGPWRTLRVGRECRCSGRRISQADANACQEPCTCARRLRRARVARTFRQSAIGGEGHRTPPHLHFGGALPHRRSNVALCRSRSRRPSGFPGLLLPGRRGDAATAPQPPASSGEAGPPVGDDVLNSTRLPPTRRHCGWRATAAIGISETYGVPRRVVS